jgi:hypothetical protein
MTKIREIRNSTSIDEYGARFSLPRWKSESLEEYYDRVYKCVIETPLTHKESFYKSLEYSTPYKAKNIFKVTFNENLIPEFYPLITISDRKIRIDSDESFEGVLERNFDEIKFLIDFVNFLESNVPNIIIEPLIENWEYLKTENVLPFTPIRTRLNFVAEGHKTLIPESVFGRIVDHLGDFTYERSEESSILDSRFYMYEDNVLTKFDTGGEFIHYEYYEYPLIIKWSPIKSYEVFKEDFDTLTHDADRKLTQEGAKIYNKILSKQNTYWGE